MAISDRNDNHAELQERPKPELASALDSAVEQSLVVRSNRPGREAAMQEPIYLMLAQRGAEQTPGSGRDANIDGGKRGAKKRIEGLFQLKKRKGLEFAKQGEVLVVMEDLDGNERVFEATVSTAESPDWDQSFNTSLVANLENWADQAGADELVVRTDEPTLRLTLARLGYMPEDSEGFVQSWMDRAGVIIRLVLDTDEVDPDAGSDPVLDSKVQKYGKGWAKLLDHMVAPIEDGDDPRVVFNAEIERLEVVSDPNHDGSETIELLGRFSPKYLSDLQFGIGEDDPQMVGAVAVGVADWDAKKQLNTGVAEEQTVFVPDEWTA